ncbi:MAG TPA: SNF2-related protein [Spirochaetota bacterium]|nr:SNF2-related protein [Spirochaetota bacterium]HPI89408.1 SNF2-related protein [Spirochaetota bacterium]HPR49528.1 SNF2-related protein [Spirochaetota bacterium]
MADFTVENLLVRKRENPGRQGITTGKFRKQGTTIYTQVKYGPGDMEYIPADILELIEAEEDTSELLRKGKYAAPIELRRNLIYEKIKGELTNIFYSMESSNTEFLPHQFKPVLQFIESPHGSLLIADEVGLGKTIEAVYIWKELQVREQARRLLIVCPAMLREKWRRDLINLFDIEAEILSAEQIQDKVNKYIHNNINRNFVYIASIEGLRPPKEYSDEKKKSYPARFARLLDEYTDMDNPLFDLVIIDEAHYLRNPETSNNRLARVLRDASRSFILLTATPVQINSENLYNILKLVNPEQFDNLYVFSRMLQSNRPVVNAIRHLWRIPADIDGVIKYLAEALENEYFKNDMVMLQVMKSLKRDRNLDHEKRVEYRRLIESRPLINQYMTRSRKRDVLLNRVKRSAQTINVSYSQYEKDVYEMISRFIRTQSLIQGTVGSFSLILRQRQMASCMFAAIKSWQNNDPFDELLWEDFGILQGDESFTGQFDSSFLKTIDRKKLRLADSKYHELIKLVKNKLDENRKTKIVLFAFFKDTLYYLQDRLEKDGIRTCLIVGGRDDKNDVIDAFRDENGPNILISSEVGSEGIDLQFSSTLVNYDLPWNPMKVEQRIGRLDRIGQKAERISIINFAVDDTIEDRVIMKLYNRINLFEETIGDLEEILGDLTDQLREDLLNPKLTEQEREERTEQNTLSIVNKREIQNKLEEEAVNLCAFNDFIIQTIQDSKALGRWLSGSDLILFVEDFFKGNYPGTIIQNRDNEPLVRFITLSKQAKSDLQDFIKREKLFNHTNLLNNKQDVACVFDFRYPIKNRAAMEHVNVRHPLIQWIKHEFENKEIKSYPVSAVKIHRSMLNDLDMKDLIKTGIYCFVVQKWEFQGIKKSKKLIFGCKPLEHDSIMDKDLSEKFITIAGSIGEEVERLADYKDYLVQIDNQIKNIQNILFEDYMKRREEFECENESFCEQQEVNASNYFERKTERFRELIIKLQEEQRDKEIPKFRGLIEKERGLLESKMREIQEKKKYSDNFADVACGIVIVEED